MNEKDALARLRHELANPLGAILAETQLLAARRESLAPEWRTDCARSRRGIADEGDAFKGGLTGGRKDGKTEGRKRRNRRNRRRI